MSDTDPRTRAMSLVEQANATDDPGERDRLLAEAARLDLQAPPEADPVADPDEEVRLMTATVEPGSDAPSRAGITGEGSGADGM